MYKPLPLSHFHRCTQEWRSLDGLFAFEVWSNSELRVSLATDVVLFPGDSPVWTGGEFFPLPPRLLGYPRNLFRSDIRGNSRFRS